MNTPRKFRFLFIALFLLALSGFGLQSCGGSYEFGNKNSQPVSHKLWDELVSQYVTPAGSVDYKGFISDSAKLDTYLLQLSNNPPNARHWSEDERMAYWINAYNAFTVKLVTTHYPVESIRDIGSKVTIPFVNTAWDVKFIRIGKEVLDLNNIEHSILRKEFQEPRIHFAIVCASVSCPPLRTEAYSAAQLDRQLEDQAIRFINDPDRNQISDKGVYLSKIFKWYKGDFTKNSSLEDYLNQYSNHKINKASTIEFLEYNWNLNE